MTSSDKKGGGLWGTIGKMFLGGVIGVLIVRPDIRESTGDALTSAKDSIVDFFGSMKKNREEAANTTTQPK